VATVGTAAGTGAAAGIMQPLYSQNENRIISAERRGDVIARRVGALSA
jgi:hypothetical protein